MMAGEIDLSACTRTEVQRQPWGAAKLGRAVHTCQAVEAGLNGCALSLMPRSSANFCQTNGRHNTVRPSLARSLGSGDLSDMHCKSDAECGCRIRLGNCLCITAITFCLS